MSRGPSGGLYPLPFRLNLGSSHVILFIVLKLVLAQGRALCAAVAVEPSLRLQSLLEGSVGFGQQADLAICSDARSEKELFLGLPFKEDFGNA